MPELVVRAATVVTMAGDGVFDGDVAVDGGRIVAAGPDVGRGDVEIEGRGMFLVPGLVQAHVHLCQTLFRGLADDLDVIDWLRERVWPFEQAHDAASMRASCRLGIAELLRGGTTTVLSMESVRHTDESFAAATDLGIRAVIGKALMDQWEPGTEMIGESTDAALHDLGALVERWHGAADGRLRVAPSPRGVRNATPELWKACVELAEDADLRLHTHVNENEAQANRLGASEEGRDVEALHRWGALNHRLVMAHCVWLSEAEQDLVRRHGPHVCHCPSANLKLASGVAPIPDYLAAGVNVALGADGAACNNRLDGFWEMRLAALVHKPRYGPRAMPAEVVLQMATRGGAWALGLQDEIGTIEPGKRADLVLVRRDRARSAPWSGSSPAVQLVYALGSDDVDTVVVDGRVVVAEGRLLSGDETGIAADADAARRALLQRAGVA